MNFKEKHAFALEKLSSFKNFIEVRDFRNMLLLSLNLESGGPEAILKQLGMGGSSPKTILPYNPEGKYYYAKIMSGLSMNDQLTIYLPVKNKLTEKFVNKGDSEIIKENLSKFEQKNMLPKSFALITPEIIDYSQQVLIDSNKKKEIIPGIDSIYVSLGELIATQNLKFIFLIEDEGDKPDIVFTINMSMDPQHHSENSIQYFDVFVDEKRELRDNIFIKMKTKDLKEGIIDMEFLKEIKETSHSELFNSHFTIIVPIKSFNPPK